LPISAGHLTRYGGKGWRVELDTLVRRVSAQLCTTEKVKLFEIMLKYSFATSAKRHGSVSLH